MSRRLLRRKVPSSGRGRRADYNQRPRRPGFAADRNTLVARRRAASRPDPGVGRTPVQEMQEIAHPSVDERTARGREAVGRTPPSIHSGWKPAADRPDPVALLEAQNLTREPDLVPVRHGRMMVSPFTFYRGAAKIMAADLADTPVAGLDAQLCSAARRLGRLSGTINRSCAAE